MDALPGDTLWSSLGKPLAVQNDLLLQRFTQHKPFLINLFILIFIEFIGITILFCGAQVQN